jgi:hypothetical protein
MHGGGQNSRGIPERFFNAVLAVDAGHTADTDCFCHRHGVILASYCEEIMWKLRKIAKNFFKGARAFFSACMAPFFCDNLIYAIIWGNFALDRLPFKVSRLGINPKISG